MTHNSFCILLICVNFEGGQHFEYYKDIFETFAMFFMNHQTCKFQIYF